MVSVNISSQKALSSLQIILKVLPPPSPFSTRQVIIIRKLFKQIKDLFVSYFGNVKQNKSCLISLTLQKTICCRS